MVFAESKRWLGGPEEPYFLYFLYGDEGRRRQRAAIGEKHHAPSTACPNFVRGPARH